MEDDAIRAVVARLSRPHPSGGEVIERAAILADGSDAGAVISWIIAHAGEPETAVTAGRGHGLHGGRLSSGSGAASDTPLRFVLPPGTLA